jgi:hypothetical protein
LIPLSVTALQGCKEALTVSPDLHIQIHVLWGGTRILQHTGVKTAEEHFFDKTDPTATLPSIPDTLSPPAGTPDGGCLCFVLRTGFQSSQGELSSYQLADVL